MALTVADYKARMRQAIGNADPSTGFELIDILNEALQYVFGYSSWKFRARAPVLLNFVANQEYANLPADFGTGGELETVDSLWSPLCFMRKASLSDISQLRGQPTQNFLTFYAAVSFPTQSSNTVPPGAARLELWPTPQASITGAFRITYKSGYTLLTLDTQVPNIPVELTSALTLTARAKTKFYEFGADNPETLAEFAAANAELDRYMDVDGRTDSDDGELTGGAAAQYLNQRGPGWFRPFSQYSPRG